MYLSRNTCHRRRVEVQRADAARESPADEARRPLDPVVRGAHGADVAGGCGARGAREEGGGFDGVNWRADAERERDHEDACEGGDGRMGGEGERRHRRERRDDSAEGTSHMNDEPGEEREDDDTRQPTIGVMLVMDPLWLLCPIPYVPAMIAHLPPAATPAVLPPPLVRFVAMPPRFSAPPLADVGVLDDAVPAPAPAAAGVMEVVVVVVEGVVGPFMDGTRKWEEDRKKEEEGGRGKREVRDPRSGSGSRAHVAPTVEAPAAQTSQPATASAEATETAVRAAAETAAAAEACIAILDVWVCQHYVEKAEGERKEGRRGEEKRVSEKQVTEESEIEMGRRRERRREREREAVVWTTVPKPLGRPSAPRLMSCADDVARDAEEVREVLPAGLVGELRGGAPASERERRVPFGNHAPGGCGKKVRWWTKRKKRKRTVTKYLLTCSIATWNGTRTGTGPPGLGPGPVPHPRHPGPTPPPVRLFVLTGQPERVQTAPDFRGPDTQPQSWYRRAPPPGGQAAADPRRRHGDGPGSGVQQTPQFIPIPAGLTVVHLPPVFDSLMDILRENRLAQLATVDQQCELM
ncbi:hypothetical protein DFH09DRAFT_1082073 [Mycena vulgaris]|nr:hypothetical protein DFH09DRAFT_1082073 [Mycena vulgaris]